MSNIESMIATWVNAWNTLDCDAMCSILGDQFLYEDVPSNTQSRTREELRNFFGKTDRFFVDVTLTLKSSCVVADMASFEWDIAGGFRIDSLTGTESGDIKRFLVPGVTVWQLSGGSVIRNSDYYCGRDMYQQIGLLPEVRVSDE